MHLLKQKPPRIKYIEAMQCMITDPAEMKEALASNFFGAKLTTDDHIVFSSEGTIF